MARATLRFGIIAAAWCLGCTSEKASEHSGTPDVPVPTREASVAQPAPSSAQAAPPGLFGGGSDRPVFGVTTDVQDMAGVLHGSTDLIVNHHLGTPNGRRAIELLSKDGKLIEEVAAVDWNLPAVGAVNQSGALLICWNRLTGSSSATGGIPMPAQGMKLVCRLRQSGGFGPELVAADDAPSWLSDVEVGADGKFVVSYYRNADGWLFGPRREGDGDFERVLDDQSFGAPVPRQP